MTKISCMEGHFLLNSCLHNDKYTPTATPKIKKCIIAIHGIRTPALNWTDIFGRELKHDERFKNWEYKTFNYGFLLAVFCVLAPVRRYLVWRLKRFLSSLIKQNYEINIIAHSYGTLLSVDVVRKSYNKNDGAMKINKLILVSAVCSRLTDFFNYIRDGILNTVHNFCSEKDEVCKLNPFGHAGYAGLIRINNSVINHRYEAEHSSWFDETEPDFYKIWRDIFAGNTTQKGGETK